MLLALALFQAASVMEPSRAEVAALSAAMTATAAANRKWLRCIVEAVSEFSKQSAEPAGDVVDGAYGICNADLEAYASAALSEARLDGGSEDSDAMIRRRRAEERPVLLGIVMADRAASAHERAAARRDWKRR